MNKSRTSSLILVFFCVQAILLFSAVAAGAAGVTVPPGIAQQIENGGWADVILLLDDTQARALGAKMRSSLAVTRDTAAIAQQKAHLYTQTKDAVLSRLPVPDFVLRKDYEYLPILYLHVNAAALDRLIGMTEVVGVSENLQVLPVLTESLPLIKSPQANTAGATGAGTYVAVLDTGVDYTRAAFGNCTAPATPGTCKVAYEECFATGGCDYDYTACTAPPYPYNCHGTNVSGIVLGVAPETQILSLDVFGTAGTADYNDILSALDWVLDPAQGGTYNIAALNMSFGAGKATAACPTDAIADAITTVKGAGIPTAVAAGNNGYTNGLSYPACGPDAISVGAVYDSDVGGRTWCLNAACSSTCTDSTSAADQVTCFSNSASFLTMLAPGSIIDAAGISMSGTSQAAPHVAGAIAALLSLSGPLTVDQVVSALTSTGTPVTDPRNSIVKPRLDLYDAASVTNPIISADPASFSFMAAEGGVNPSDQVLNISNDGAGTLSWNLNDNASWLDEDATGGTAPSTVTLSVDTTGLTAGTYDAQVSIDGTGALNSPLAVPVTLQVVDSAYSEDFETNDFSKFPWETGGSASWTVQGTTLHTGTYAAQSGAIGDGETTYLQVVLNVTSPGHVYFWLKTSTQPFSDNVKFYIDSHYQGLLGGWSGDTDWTFITSDDEVGTGLHLFKWIYAKDGSLSGGSDAVWVDDIFFPPSSQLVPHPSILPNPHDFGNIISGSSSTAVTFTVSNTGTADLVITSASLTGANAGDFVTENDTCTGQTVSAAGSCTVDVRFTPHSLGAKTANLSISSNYPLLAEALLSGTGTVAYTLTVSKDPAGTGTGTVTSVPSGISCGADCSEPYAQGTGVVLTAMEDSGSVFSGWSGGCSGTGTCSVTMDGNTAVTARFDAVPPTAEFSGSPLSGEAPLYVDFSDSSTNSPVSWAWTFGDGGTSAVQNPSHNFKTAGTYTISLTATNAGGPDSVTKTDYITVSACLSDPAKVSGVEYPTLQQAYDAAPDGGTVLMHAVDFVEDVDCNQPVLVTLDGGYGCSYAQNPAASTIVGSLTITDGTVTVDKIIIQ